MCISLSCHDDFQSDRNHEYTYASCVLCVAQELLQNESYRQQIKAKAREAEEKDLVLQAEQYKEGLVATPAKTLAKGHAASTSFGKQEIREEPSSTGNTFQPGSWVPNPKK